MVIESRFLFRYILKGYSGITLFPFIFVADKGDVRVIAHEKIHIRQQKKYLIFGFYFLYVLHYLAGLLKYKNHREAYLNIPFEKEAYKNETK